MKGRIALAAALLLLASLLGVGDAGGRALVVSTVTVEVIGKGTVGSSPAGISCGNGARTCTIAFSGSGGTNVTLTAIPAKDWSFAGWNGCPEPVGNTCQVPVNGSDSEVTANFTGPPTTTSTLSVTFTGDGRVAGGAIDCGSSPTTACTWTVLTGSTLTVHEEPAAGSVFSGWGGACGGSGVACTVTMDGDRSLSASWVKSTDTALLTVSITGGGSVAGGGISCPSTCVVSEPLNSAVTLTARPADGFIFTGWSGDCAGTASTCVVTMNGAKAVSATFAPVVQLSLSVTGSGNVSGGAGAINCGANANLCSAGFAQNSTVVLTATPASGATFLGWSGACGGTATSCTLLMSDARSVGATFSTAPVPTVSLTVSVSGIGTVSGGGINCGNGATTCSADEPVNASVTLTATSGSGATFTGWAGACAGIATTCTVSMTSAKSASASFAGGTVLLSVVVTGKGTVTGGGISCGNGVTTCSAGETANSTVTLTATPAHGASFTGWAGDCAGTATTCMVTMDAAKSVSATFAGAAARRTLTIKVAGRGTVRSSAGKCVGDGRKKKTCVQRFASGTRIVLTAIPAAGGRFSRWGGACTGKKKKCTVTLRTAKTVTATFTSRRREF